MKTIIKQKKYLLSILSGFMFMHVACAAPSILNCSPNIGGGNLQFKYEQVESKKGKQYSKIEVTGNLFDKNYRPEKWTVNRIRLEEDQGRSSDLTSPLYTNNPNQKHIAYISPIAGMYTESSEMDEDGAKLPKTFGWYLQLQLNEALGGFSGYLATQNITDENDKRNIILYCRLNHLLTPQEALLLHKNRDYIWIKTCKEPTSIELAKQSTHYQKNTCWDGKISNQDHEISGQEYELNSEEEN